MRTYTIKYTENTKKCALCNYIEPHYSLVLDDSLLLRYETPDSTVGICKECWDKGKRPTKKETKSKPKYIRYYIYDNLSKKCVLKNYVSEEIELRKKYKKILSNVTIEEINRTLGVI